MSNEFQHLEVTDYQARLYPEGNPPASVATPKLGVCLSGGGSRALTCALGQLSGLRGLPDPDDSSKTLLDRVDYLSSVSGGSWASVLFSFLPETIDGQPVSDDDFLIAPTAPEKLFKGGEDEASAGNVSYLNPFCLGTAPQQFDLENIAKFLYTMHQWGLLGQKEKWSWFWIAAVGEIILKPFGLYDAFYDPSKTFIQPSRYFSLSDCYIRDSITAANPSLDPSQFYTVRPGRPPLFVNTNVLQDESVGDSAQIPVQATPVDTGLLGQSPDGTLRGGGSVESFAFTSHLGGHGTDPGTAAVSVERRYSLCDIAGCSSAFFAAFLIQYMDAEIDKILDALESHLEKLHVPKLVARAIGKAIEQALEPVLNADAADLIPRYKYWPLAPEMLSSISSASMLSAPRTARVARPKSDGLPGEVGEPNPTNLSYGFSDGGDFEDTGVLGMLARTDASRLISFVNSSSPIGKDSSTGQITVSGQIPILFGYLADLVDGKYVSYGGMSSSEPRSYAQVFSDANGELEGLLQGLYDASSGSAGLGTDTAAFTQTLITVENPVAHIEAGREVKVLWVYNSRVNRWQDAVSDEEIRADLERGQSNQHPDGTEIKRKGHGTGPVANFPYYSTGTQVHIDKEGVNMLAQLSAWNVQQLAEAIRELLK